MGAGGVEGGVVCGVVGDSINDEDRCIAPELSQPLVWACDMRHVTGQWTGECEACNDSRDVMQVPESIACGSINRWGVRTVCQGLSPLRAMPEHSSGGGQCRDSPPVTSSPEWGLSQSHASLGIALSPPAGPLPGAAQVVWW